MTRKGIILAGGSGTRLHPVTLAVSKQLLPVYNKPMIYYPLTTLLLAGVRDILLISTENDIPQFQRLLGKGERFGINLDYAVQDQPNGIAEALIIAKKWLAGSPSVLILGDNILHADSLSAFLHQADQRTGATIFAYQVQDPERYGVVAFNREGGVADIVEKPQVPPSHWAVTGLYFYDERAPDLAETLKPSGRGELEITDLNRLYLQEGTLKVEKFSRGCAWLDAGTTDSLLQAATFVQSVEQRQGLLVGSPEEAAFRSGLIDRAALLSFAGMIGKTDFGQKLAAIAAE